MGRFIYEREIWKQIMSATKSRIWFSPRIPSRIKDQVVGIFGIPTTDRIGTYLRTPIFTTCGTTNSYQFLVDKIQKRIEGWQAKYLSMISQATLIKETATSIPIYAMQTMLLPQKISFQIDKLSCKFLWGILLRIVAVKLSTGKLSPYQRKLEDGA